jgi:predicted nucleic acid-binding protein
VRLVVSNTGPVLHLYEAAVLGLLALMGEVHIPQEVETELERLVGAEWQKPSWLLVTRVDETFQAEAGQWQQAGLLDRGEAEAIALARQINANWFFTDDAAARLVARSLGIAVHGSLGIVLGAAAMGQVILTEADAALEALAHSSLWISANVLNEARQALRNLFED